MFAACAVSRKLCHSSHAAGAEMDAKSRHQDVKNCLLPLRNANLGRHRETISSANDKKSGVNIYLQLSTYICLYIYICIAIYIYINIQRWISEYMGFSFDYVRCGSG